MDEFANFFKPKSLTLILNANLRSTVYDGKQKIIGTEKLFMNSEAILACGKSPKTRNSEGNDRIPKFIQKME